MEKKITVSVVVITYNQEAYIVETLEGILKQEGDFCMEVIISNDCSPDNTNVVIQQFIQDNKDNPRVIFKYFNHASNLGVIRNFDFALNQVTGKYVAFCEGDDYWITTSKLDRQVKVLEEDTTIALSNTNYDIYYQNTGTYIYKDNDEHRIKHDYKDVKISLPIEDILEHKYFIRTATVLLRSSDLKEYLKSDIYNESFGKLLMGDTPLWAYIIGGSDRKVHYFEDSLAVYRRSDNTASNMLKVDKYNRFHLSCIEMAMYFIDSKKYKLSPSFVDYIVGLYNKRVLKYYLFDPNYSILFPAYLSSKSKKKLNKLMKYNVLRLIKLNIKKASYGYKQLIKKVK